MHSGTGKNNREMEGTVEWKTTKQGERGKERWRKEQAGEGRREREGREVYALAGNIGPYASPLTTINSSDQFPANPPE